VPYGSGHTLLGAMPATVHAAPRDVAVVGLGSGDTAWASAWRPETRSLTVFEISAPQPRILWRLVGFLDVVDTRHLLEDPRLHIRIEDGRKALEARDDRFDLIETDATWPETAGSGNLYSLEFFRAASRRLRPGGLMCTWAPTPRVVATFRSVFPYALEAEGGDVLIGSLEPIAYAREAWTARAATATPYLGAARVRDVLEAVSKLKPAGAPPSVSLNRDLWPRDEYAVK
jgi:spermidine synthase